MSGQRQPLLVNRQRKRRRIMRTWVKYIKQTSQRNEAPNAAFICFTHSIILDSNSHFAISEYFLFCVHLLKLFHSILRVLRFWRVLSLFNGFSFYFAIFLNVFCRQLDWPFWPCCFIEVAVELYPRAMGVLRAFHTISEHVAAPTKSRHISIWPWWPGKRS